MEATMTWIIRCDFWELNILQGCLVLPKRSFDINVKSLMHSCWHVSFQSLEEKKRLKLQWHTSSYILYIHVNWRREVLTFLELVYKTVYYLDKTKTQIRTFFVEFTESYILWLSVKLPNVQEKLTMLFVLFATAIRLPSFLQSVLFKMVFSTDKEASQRQPKIGEFKKKKMGLENGDMQCSVMCHFPHNTTY